MSTFPPYEILRFDEGNFCNSLANEYCEAEFVKRKACVDYLFGYLSSTDLAAKSIIVEYEYTDGDHLEDFSAYYLRCFAHYRKRCKRVHFFDFEIVENDLLEAIHGDNESIERLRRGYLGFIIARPLPDTIIGRTVLKPYGDDYGRRVYSCTREYDANLFGITLPVPSSLAFQEQDSVVAACATTALWCAFQKLSHYLGNPTPRPALITQAATATLHLRNRSFPSRGLVLEQMCDAIISVGMEHELLDESGFRKTDLISYIYAYLCKGWPVILGVEIPGVGLHAIAITGYSMTQDRCRPVPADPKVVRTSGLRIDEFYVHDDQVGPFARMAIKDEPGGEIKFSGDWHDGAGQTIELIPKAVLVPVYKKIRIAFEDVHKIITIFNDFLSPLTYKLDYEWDTYLITTNELKDETRRGNYSDPVSRKLLLAQHPKYIWKSAFFIGGIRILEILADATDLAGTCPYAIVWHHDEARSLVSTYTSSSARIREKLKKVLSQETVTLVEKSFLANPAWRNGYDPDAMGMK